MRSRLGPGDASGLPRLSRRRLLALGALSGFGTLLAACVAGQSPSPPASPSVPAGSPSPSATPADTPESSEPSGSPEPSVTASPEPTLREKIAGILLVGFRGLTLADAPWLRTALAETGLGGVILFDRDQETGGKRNITSPRQLRSLVDELHAAADGRRVLVSVDQEGGIVTRLSPAHGFPAVASEATVGRGTASAARAWAKALAATLADAGIDLNFAPVVDLDVNPRSPAIGALDRSFGADPDVVVRMATIEVDAHRAAGVLTTLKHFPGIGSSTTNTDFGVADVTDTWTRAELEPFRRLIASGDADLVMAGHVVNRRLDPDRPASLSKAVVTDLLRGELGWDGVVVTDDLQAAAIDAAFGREDAAVLALEAGNDLLLFANQQTYDPDVVDAIVGAIETAVAAGRIAEARIDEAWRRVQGL